MSDKIFAKGIRFDRPREGSPDFVKGKISVNVKEFTEFLNQYQANGWVNLDLLKSQKEGNPLYLQLNVWKKPESMLTDVEKDNIRILREKEIKAKEVVIDMEQAYKDF